MTWGARSKGRAATTHPDIQKVSKRVDEFWSSTVLDGRRSNQEQRKNVDSSYSQTMESLHLIDFSSEPEEGVDAIDIAPDPFKWPQLKKKVTDIDALIEAVSRDGLSKDDRRELASKIRKALNDYGKEIGRWYAFCGYYHCMADVMYKAGEISAPMRHGYDWDGDHILTDQRFDDLPHHERRPV